MYTEKIKHGEKYEHVLMSAIGFTEDDLEANRQRVFSESQLKELRWQRTKNLLYTMGFIVLIAGFGLSWIGLFGIIGICHSLWQLYHISLDLNGGRVDVAQGLTRIELRNSGKSISYFVHVEAMAFDVKQDVFLAFKNEEHYCVYYTPNAKRMLSAEWVR